MSIVTEENVVEKRAEMDGMIQAMIDGGKEIFEPYIE